MGKFRQYSTKHEGNKMEKETKLMLLTSIFVTSVAVSSLIASKVASFFGIFAAVGVIAWSISFPMTDVICEVWGREKAQKVVWIGLICFIITAVLVKIAVYLPSAPFWENQKAFATTFELVWRILIAGAISYIVSQTHDVFSFSFWKKLTKGKHLWLRNNLSTIVSQLIDSILFTLIVFLGVLELNAILSMSFGVFIIKVIIAICDTPFVYLLVRWARS